jgi:hypothetical protein
MLGVLKQLCCLLQVPFKYVDDVATLWCEWAEMELRHNNFKTALDVMRRATQVKMAPAAAAAAVAAMSEASCYQCSAVQECLLPFPIL